MTREQKIFLIGKEALRRYDEIREQRELTYAENQDYQNIQAGLFKTIIRYGMSKATERTHGYLRPSDMPQDIQGALTVIFFERLKEYDPTRATPTTFFCHYFDQEITKFLCKDSQHMNQYDRVNLSKVKKAISDFESNGIQWTEEMVAKKAGLSIKVTRNTILRSKLSIYADIDESPNVKAVGPNPEEAYIRKETQETIMNVINKVLSEEEKDILFYKVNLDEDKDRNYTDVAEHFNMSNRDMKQSWSTLIGKLRSNPELLQYNPKGYKETEMPSVVKKPKVHDVYKRNISLSLGA